MKGILLPQCLTYYMDEHHGRGYDFSCEKPLYKRCCPSVCLLVSYKHVPQKSFYSKIYENLYLRKLHEISSLKIFQNSYLKKHYFVLFFLLSLGLCTMAWGPQSFFILFFLKKNYFLLLLYHGPHPKLPYLRKNFEKQFWFQNFFFFFF